jgi:PadR family transcriptional regulator, regulatory protein PadR
MREHKGDVTMEHNAADQDDGAREAGAAPYPKNWLTAVLLLSLRDWSSYGYELMERLAAFGFAAMNPGTLYRVLRQMERDGMVSSSWDTSGAGPARRVYSITEAGNAYLKLWAGSLEQYRQMMETFFQLYAGQPSRKDPHE